MEIELTDSQQSLTQGPDSIYVITRLYDIWEKVKAEHVEKAIQIGIGRGLESLGLKQEAMACFVPFRDSDLDARVLSSDNPSKTIYELDINRIRKTFAIVGFFDGLSKDEGMAMEIGFAYGNQKPIVLVLTDFVIQRGKTNLMREFIVDPIIESMVGKIIWFHEIKRSRARFMDDLLESFSHVLDLLSAEVALLVQRPEQYIKPMPTRTVTQQPPTVFIDFGGGRFEWQREYSMELAEGFIRQGINVSTGNRFHPSANYTKYSECWDLVNASNADVLVLCGDGDEMDSGSAALVGYGKALDKKVLLYDTKSTVIAIDEHTEEHTRNFMISYAANAIVDERKDIIDVAMNLLSTALNENDIK